MVGYKKRLQGVGGGEKDCDNGKDGEEFVDL